MSEIIIIARLNMEQLKYLSGYAPQLLSQIQTLLDENRLGKFILKKYPTAHDIRSQKALYEYTMELKNDYLRKSKPLSKVVYDEKISVINHALGLHTQISRVQGGRLKSKNEIRIASLFKQTPPEFLRMIVVHELAHIKEKNHDKAFYQLCEYMEPDYHQLEFDSRLYLTYLDYGEPLY
ncbi:MAG: putative metal-dependent hydrolase [Cellvibrionaceae bacterium]|jgi:predicted metal-dependent hydrolase